MNEILEMIKTVWQIFVWLLKGVGQIFIMIFSFIPNFIIITAIIIIMLIATGTIIYKVTKSNK